MKPDSPQNVKYFIGALYSDTALLDQAQKLCQAKIGDIDSQSDPFLFELTNYYDQEMGSPIFRKFISFETLMSPGKLAKLKVVCNHIEEQLAVQGERKVNLDIGYLDFHKMILASAKYNGQKIYLDEGIYADLTLVYESGKFHPVENTFPDFKSGQYNETFLAFRERYKTQLKAV